MLRLLNPANLATFARLALAPWIAVAMSHELPLRALVLFCIAGLTDVVDGGLARRFGWTTAAGAYLDPIADKMLLSTVFICLAEWGALPWWFVAVVFGRDVLILAASAFALAFTRLRKFPPSFWGKLSTFLQILTATSWMSQAPFLRNFGERRPPPHLAIRRYYRGQRNPLRMAWDSCLRSH